MLFLCGKSFGLWGFFPYWEIRDLCPTCAVCVQYGAICSPTYMPFLPSGNCIFDSSRAYMCYCRGAWTNFCFPCRWKWHEEGAIYTERFGVRQSLLWRIKWSLQKGILFPFTYKIHNPNCWLCSWDIFFTRSLKIWLLAFIYLDSSL